MDIADVQSLGYIPFRDHTASDVDMRIVWYGVRKKDVDAKKRRVPTDGGDLQYAMFWPEERSAATSSTNRRIGSWSFAAPAILHTAGNDGGSPGPPSTGLTSSRGGADAASSSGGRGGKDKLYPIRDWQLAADKRYGAATLISDGDDLLPLAPAVGARPIPAPPGQKEPGEEGLRYQPITGRRSLEGTIGFMVPGSEEKEQHALFFPAWDQTLIVQQNGEDIGSYSTRVVDVQGRSIDRQKVAGTHSAWWVKYVNGGVAQVALNLTSSNDPSGVGFGLAVIRPPDGNSSSAAQGQATGSDGRTATGTTMLAPGATTESGASWENRNANGPQYNNSGGATVTGGSGLSATNNASQPTDTQGRSGDPQKKAAEQGIAYGDTGKPSGPGMLAYLSWEKGGFVHPGERGDFHKLYTNKEGEDANPAHLWTEGKWFGLGGDGPLLFEAGPHVPGAEGNQPYNVHLRWDAALRYWRWHVMVPLYQSDPPPVTPPPKKEPPEETGGGVTPGGGGGGRTTTPGGTGGGSTGSSEEGGNFTEEVGKKKDDARREEERRNGEGYRRGESDPPRKATPFSPDHKIEPDPNGPFGPPSVPRPQPWFDPEKPIPAHPVPNDPRGGMTPIPGYDDEKKRFRKSGEFDPFYDCPVADVHGRRAPYGYIGLSQETVVTSLVGRPTPVVDADPLRWDSRYDLQPTVEKRQRWRRLPTVGRIEAFGSEAGGGLFNTNARGSAGDRLECTGGTTVGGFVVTSPQRGMEQFKDGFGAAGFEPSDTYFGVMGPEVAFASGTPNPKTGRFANGWVHTSVGLGDYVFGSTDADGAATREVVFVPGVGVVSENFLGFKSGRNATAYLSHRNVVDREYFFPDEDMVVEKIGHGRRHVHGGQDEIARETASAFAIPKAGADGTLDPSWFPLELRGAAKPKEKQHGGPIVLIDPKTGKEINLLKGDNGSITAVDPETGKEIDLTKNGGTIVLIDPVTGRPIDFTHGGGPIVLIDPATGETISLIPQGTGRRWELIWQPGTPGVHPNMTKEAEERARNAREKKDAADKARREAKEAAKAAEEERKKRWAEEHPRRKRIGLLPGEDSDGFQEPWRKKSDIEEAERNSKNDEVARRGRSDEEAIRREENERRKRYELPPLKPGDPLPRGGVVGPDGNLLKPFPFPIKPYQPGAPVPTGISLTPTDDELEMVERRRQEEEYKKKRRGVTLQFGGFAESGMQLGLSRGKGPGVVDAQEPPISGLTAWRNDPAFYSNLERIVEDVIRRKRLYGLDGPPGPPGPQGPPGACGPCPGGKGIEVQPKKGHRGPVRHGKKIVQLESVVGGGCDCACDCEDGSTSFVSDLFDVGVEDGSTGPYGYKAETVEKLHSAISFRATPVVGVDRAKWDVRYDLSPTPEKIDLWKKLPIAARVEAFGFETTGGNFSKTAVGPNGKRYVGDAGTVSGGLVFGPPELGLEHYASSYAPAGVTASATYFTTIRGKSEWGSGFPDPTTGNVISGYTWGSHDTTGKMTFWQRSSVGAVATTQTMPAVTGTLAILSGTGTTNRIPKWGATSGELGDSSLTDSGTDIKSDVQLYFADGLGSTYVHIAAPTDQPLRIGFGARNLRIKGNASDVFAFYDDTTGVQLKSTYPLRWSSGSINAASDTGFARSAAGIVKVTDGGSGYGILDAATLREGGTTLSSLYQGLDSDLTNLAVSNYLPAFTALAGTTFSFPAIKRSGKKIQFRLADDSAYAQIESETIRIYDVTFPTYYTDIYANNPTANRAILLPDASGTMALTSDLTGFQPLDADLTSIAALGTAADKILYTTAAHTWDEATITAFGRGLIDDAAAVNGRNTLGFGRGLQADCPSLASGEMWVCTDKSEIIVGMGA